MRRTKVGMTGLLLIVGLVVGPAASAPAPDPAPVRADGPASYAFIKAKVLTAPGLGQVAVGMPNPRVVKVQHRTLGGDWSRPTTLFRKKGVTCGEIAGRASAGGVVVQLECDTPYYEDQAPARSMGFVTRDLRTWVGKRLPGEAYQDPAISASGAYAAFLADGAGLDFVRYGASSGWSTGLSSFEYDSGGEAVVVDDAGTVTVIGPEFNVDGQCGLGVHDVALSGAEDFYEIAGVEPGCTESTVDNVDDRTVTGGGTTREFRFAVTREPGERWELTLPPPASAPGLEKYRGSKSRTIRQFFSRAEGLPLVSFGSPDRRQLRVQVFDEDSATWDPPTTIRDHGFPGCAAVDRFFLTQAPKVHAIEVHCYPRPSAQGDYPPRSNGGVAPPHKIRLFTSPDARTWTQTVIDRRPFGISRSGRLLAAAGPDSIAIVSPEGTTTVPRSASGPCDFVFPIGPASVLRFHGGQHARWPTKLQKSVAGSPWRTIQVLEMPDRGGCRDVSTTTYDLPSLFHLEGPPQTIKLTVLRGGKGGWHVERTGYRF